MSKQVACPKCGVILKVIETEVQSDGYSSPIVFSCAYCGHFLGIAPYVCDVESQVADIHSAVSRLHADVGRLLAALPAKKAKKSK
jgi:uncharacterized Zn finger protein